MLIECIIRRPNGSTPKLGTVQYHFRPQKDDERHLCEVTEPTHIARFLSIRRSFRAANPSEAIPAEVAQHMHTPATNIRQVRQRRTWEEPEIEDTTEPVVQEMDAQEIAETKLPPLMELEPEKMSVEELSRYGEVIFKIDPTSKEQIGKYAEQNWGLKISKKLAPHNMIRNLLNAAQEMEAEQKALEEASFESAPPASEPEEGAVA